MVTEELNRNVNIIITDSKGLLWNNGHFLCRCGDEENWSFLVLVESSITVSQQLSVEEVC